MHKNVIPPKSVSFEQALWNLASRMTGQPAAKLPRTQEGIVQFMAENAPTFDEMAQAVTQEILARLDVNKLAQAVTQKVLAQLAPATPGQDGKRNTAPVAPACGGAAGPAGGAQQAHNGPGAPEDTAPGQDGKPNTAPAAGNRPRGAKAGAKNQKG